MRLLSRTIFREIFVTAVLGMVPFIFVLFLHSSRELFTFLVRSSGSPSSVAYLFALVLPQALPYAIPLGVLVGTLITLGRMSSDGEITAMRAAGVPSRRVVPPILTFGFLAMLMAASASLWLTPWSIRESLRVEKEMLARQVTADVEPRVFDEQFPNSILYVSDVTSGPVPRWRNILLADVTPPAERKPGTAERGDSPVITLASEALAVPDVGGHRIQLALHDASMYQTGKDASDDYQVSSFGNHDEWVEAQKPSEVGATHPSREMDTVPLYRQVYRDSKLDREQRLDGRIEFQERFALPLACMLLTLTGVPLGISTRRSGKSVAVVLTVAIVFLYYMGLISCVGLARQGVLRPEIAAWLPDAAFLLIGLLLIARLEAPGDHDWIGRVASSFRSLGRAPQERARVLDRFGPGAWLARLPLLPQLVDTYVLTSFLFYFAVLLAIFVFIFHVFTFFQLLNDIIKNRPSSQIVLQYHFFLTPRLIYEFTPLSVLAAVLAVFGVLTKNNEVTAFKACGVSMYRLAAPILIASFVLSGSLFAFDHYWVPEFDRRQDALYAVIKGKPAQTYLRPDRNWTYGLKDRVYYYKYFDPVEDTMLGVNVYEIDPEHFRLKRQISAARARWQPDLDAWVFQDGWSRDLDPAHPEGPLRSFDSFETRSFPELEEKPAYFVHEVRQSQQMNFLELRDRIQELQQSGFDTVALQVQLQKKFSVPMFAVIMAIVSIPFAFLTGNRGAMAGVGVSFAIFILYYSIGQVFEQVGNLGQLPAAVAAWSPDAIFSLFGLYFLARLRT